MKRFVALTAILTFFVSGCVFGGNVQKFDLAVSGAGASGSLDIVNGSVIAAELLSVNDSSLVVLSGFKVNFVRWTSIRTGSFEAQSMKASIQRRRPSEERFERLRLMSRYPQGIDESLLSALLFRYGGSYETL